jgi:hypothetical protein
MYNILVIYHYDNRYEFPVRATKWDHLYSFRHYSPHRHYYLNVAFHKLPNYLIHVKFDLVIFHTIFLSSRWDLSLFKQLVDEVESLKLIKAIKVVMPQDEFIHTDVLCDFINSFQIDYVFSIFPESEWPKIYHKVNCEKTKFYKILAGYIDESSVRGINQLSSNSVRDIDIGYRAHHNAPWLGRHGMLKVKVAELFQKDAPRKGLITDISTQQKDVLLGDAWQKFLIRCKYVIGVPGGASILDRDGTLKARTEDYLRNHPQANFEEIENACFQGMDGSLTAAVITPRHLEACTIRTCQILVEGDYNGILKPDKHYIELKSDFRNLDQVLDLVQHDNLRERITSNAYRDIVESGQYTYREMVRFILEKSLGTEKMCQRSLSKTFFVESFLYYWVGVSDRLDWMNVAFLWRKGLWWRWINRVIHAVLPVPVVLFVRRVKQILRKGQ